MKSQENLSKNTRLSIILPAYNEADIVGSVVKGLCQAFPQAEVLLINDNSTDATAAEAERAGAKVISHQYNMGNGAAIKTGVRHAKGEILVFMDADGQHDAGDVQRLLDKIGAGYELVIGARGSASQTSKGRLMGNVLLNRLASLLTEFEIEDLTSGFRATKASTFRQFLYLLPNGFSYPTTSTMAFLRSGYPVAFVPIVARRRKGKSKIHLIRDGVRFLVIVVKMTTLFSPMRVFFPMSLIFFILGMVRYIHFYWQTGNFSNVAGLLFATAVLVFLIGLISEQITALHYGLSGTYKSYDGNEST